ncbi:aldo/keto reductase [Thiohalocapsa halophila]|uniref:Aldo/keto reductase n=1 Tax=Thiohalocapsa halophila TaxID=69359 RepID=A0ABS1CKG3_9GAMM|nr:aldo/keto reductase [Thiohalocapsa halophila]MBK1632188.1 aldo/keto reductase [Thiohalocapsa halophila]
MSGFDPSRRRLLHAASGLLAAGALPGLALGATAGAGPSAASALTKPIPASGEPLPAIGMGTWITFNVGDNASALATRRDILDAFFAAGGGMIDSSPMYGSAEAVLGNTLPADAERRGLFSATKVWTSDGDAGRAEIEQSRGLWQLPRFDLLQVHNLLAWRAHLETLKAMRANGQVRYIGMTTSHGRRHRELERVMQGEPIDFVQLTYNIVDREAEARLLPLAEERGIAVIANRPYRRGALPERAAGKPLPGWGKDIGCDTWPQALLTFIVSHPAVTCAIPATSRVDHMRENMAAARGPLPDAALRRRMAADFAKL